MGRAWSRHLLALLLISAVTFLLMEVAVRVLLPQPHLYPRFLHSERLGHMLPASATLVHELPGAWSFVYRTNEYGFRVGMPPVSNRYERPAVVVLGDSNSFGMGVNDGEEYPAVLAQLLEAQASVVNLAVPSFGLTHQVRVFYEFGLLFEPTAVVLQFTSNDPDDNFGERVASVEAGRFRFHPHREMSAPLAALKNWLSGSIVQRSSAYNFVRNYAHTAWSHRGQAHWPQSRAPREAFYNELLQTFAEDLQRRGIALLVFDMPGHFDRWPGIRREVEQLQAAGRLRLLDPAPWFKGAKDYGTPEGHYWGAKGHRIVAGQLAPWVRAALGAPPVRAAQF